MLSLGLGQFHCSSAKPHLPAGLHAELHQWAVLDGPAGRGENQLWLERHQPGLFCPAEAVWGSSKDERTRSNAQISISTTHFFADLFTTCVSLWQNFISKCLEPKEATITKLNEDGEKLIAAEHPGKNVIEVNFCPHFLGAQRWKIMRQTYGNCFFKCYCKLLRRTIYLWILLPYKNSNF